MTQFEIPLSKKAQSLISDFHMSLRGQYMDDRMISGSEKFVLCYKRIKDDSWPEISSYQEFDYLPEAIKKECLEQHDFSREIWRASIERDVDLWLPIAPQSLTRAHPTFMHLLERNHNLFSHKNIIDFACNFGYYSFFAAANQCANVLGVDVRRSHIDIAKAIQETCDHGSGDRVEFQLGDIHDHSNNRQLCLDRDVCFLFGILYHVHDHYDILHSVCSPKMTTVIIETGISELDHPVIEWQLEPTFEVLSGWFGDFEQIVVGYPSVSYIDLVMTQLGFIRTDQCNYLMYSSWQRTEEFRLPRAGLVYQRR